MTKRAEQKPAPTGLAGRSWFVPSLLSLVATGLFALRLLTPSNLLDQDQERPGSYVLDVLKNGHWMCQRDLTGDVTSKPPMWTWISAITSLAIGQVNRFTLYLPGAIGAWGTALLVYFFGRKRFGMAAGIYGAIGVMVCTAGLKEFGLARTDGVFALTVTATALAAFAAWTTEEKEHRSRWIVFWAWAAVATLTKGPLGVVLGLAGLVAVTWEKRSGEPLPLRGSQVSGVALFILITGGWFALAYNECGPALWQKMIGKELVGHVATSAKGTNFPGKLFYQPTLYYLGRGAPWSLFALYALWRVWKTPAAETKERRFERFLFCWFVIGLVIFSLAPHQRGDLLWPIMPAGALLAGRQLQALAQRYGQRVVYGIGVVTLGMISGFGFYYGRIQPKQSINRQTAELKRLAEQLKVQKGEFPLTYVDAPMALQIMLNTWHPKVSVERAAELLRGNEPVYVAVKSLGRLELAGLTNGAQFHLLLPKEPRTATNVVRVVSNRAGLQAGEGFVLGTGPFIVTARRASLEKAGDESFTFSATAPLAEVTVSNTSKEVRKVRVEFSNRELKPQVHELAPGEIWRLAVP